MTNITAPDRAEAAKYYFNYIDQVPGGDICEVLQAQLPETLALLNGISEERSLHRYAPDKWTIRQVGSHLNDTERLFVFRALWFARGFDSPLPSFDHNIAIATAGADDRPWSSHVEEFWPFARRPWRSSRISRRTHGAAAASPAETHSQCARWPIFRPATSRTI